MHVNLLEKFGFAVNLIFFFDDFFYIHFRARLTVYNFVFEGIDDFVGAWDYATESTEMLHGERVVHGETHIFDHLAGVKLDNESTLLAGGSLGNGFGGEGPKCDRTDNTDLYTLFGSEFASFVAYTGHGAECHHEIVCIFDSDFLPAAFVAFDGAVTLLEHIVDDFHLGRLEFERGYDIALTAVLATIGSPWALLADFLVGAARALLGKLDFLHHLAHDAVCENHNGIGILESEVEAETYEVNHFLDRRGSEHDKMVVTVATTLCGLEIVGLRRLYGAEARPPRITLRISVGKEEAAIYDIPSIIRLMPGDEEEVITALPVPAPPYTILIAASSDSA